MVHLQPPTPQIYPQLNFRGGKMPCDSISVHMVVCSCFHRAPGSPLPQTVGINHNIWVTSLAAQGRVGGSNMKGVR